MRLAVVHLLLATSKSRHAVGPGVVVTVSPKHPLSLGSVYEPPRPGATDRRPRFHTPRGLSAEIGKDPRFAKLETIMPWVVR